MFFSHSKSATFENQPAEQDVRGEARKYLFSTVTFAIRAQAST
jgi:hypothetical protein